MQGRIPRVAGFSLWELAKVLLFFHLLVVTIAVLFPLFATARSGSKRSCASHLKNIGMAMMMYAQDYDGRFPPARSFQKTENGRVLRVNWGGVYHLEKNGERIRVEGLVFPYLKNDRAFRCPDVKPEKSWNPFQAPPPVPERETYMYNDLAATEKLDDFANPTNTVLIAEGEDMERNVGHAWEPDLPPQQAAFDRWGKCRPERGATVQHAPTRHNGGAFYAFADGHCKWVNPEEVFFPSRLSADVAHDGDSPGPNPAGPMTRDGRRYGATFHLR